MAGGVGMVNVAGEIKIIALPNPTVPALSGDGLDDIRKKLLSDARGLGYEFIPEYSTLDQFIRFIRAVLRAQMGCLRVLEIVAHGNPFLCDGIGIADAASFGAKLKTLPLCDVVDIFLSGCNTGVNADGGPSVAQVLSQNAPTVAADNVQCTVFGSVGYISGTDAQNNAKCSTTTTTGKGKNKVDYPKFPPSQDGTLPGSMKAKGKACFRGFREGKAI